MRRLPVAVTADFLSGLAKSTRVALQEIIDNALDADATTVEVTFDRDDALSTIIAITVSDNGDGMTFRRATSAFGSLGNSWKVGEPYTSTGRRRLGSRGQGRWTALALGNTVTWTSVADAGGEEGRQRVEIRADTDHLDGFDISDAPVSDTGPTGTVVKVRDVEAKGQSADSPKTRAALTHHYAVELASHSALSITIDSRRLDPEEATLDVEYPPIAVERDDLGADAPKLRIILWDAKVRASPQIVLCDAAGRRVGTYRDGIPYAPWPYTAVITWDGFTESAAVLDTPTMWDDRLADVIDAVVTAVDASIEARRTAARTTLLTQWKTEDSYPYTAAPRGPVEEVERDLFDLVAVTAAPALSSSDARGRKFALAMLREAVTRDPSNLTSVLHQVLDLEQGELDDLAELLRRTTLSSLVGAGRLVLRRLDILGDLHALLHDTEIAPRLGEKKHLHEIVAAEPWVFGDEYTTAVSERELTAVLQAHRTLLGKDRILLDPTVEPKPSVDGVDGRVDLMLSRIHPISERTRQHLVVELKRPSQTIGLDQIMQLEKYAFAIRSDRRFHVQDVKWDFLLIGSKLNEHAMEKAGDFERSAKENFRIRVLTWDELIHTRRHQLRFVQDALNLSTTQSGNLDEVRRLYSEHLPDDIAATAPAS